MSAGDLMFDREKAQRKRKLHLFALTFEGYLVYEKMSQSWLLFRGVDLFIRENCNGEGGATSWIHA
jgi:hypothetical protein